MENNIPDISTNIVVCIVIWLILGKWFIEKNAIVDIFTNHFGNILKTIIFIILTIIVADIVT